MVNIGSNFDTVLLMYFVIVVVSDAMPLVLRSTSDVGVVLFKIDVYIMY